MRILCAGRRRQVFLNGQKIQDVSLDAYPDQEKAHPALRRPDGHIGLQNHGSRIAFRHVRVRPVKPDG